MHSEPFVIEIVLSTSVYNVWKAITNSREMKQWYFDVPGFRPEPGFEFMFSSAPEEERKYHHNCQVTECKRFKKLAFSWQYNRYEALTLVTFELFEQADEETRFKVSHVGLDSFPDYDPDFSKDSFIAGWNWIIGTALREYIEKTYAFSEEPLSMHA